MNIQKMKTSILAFIAMSLYLGSCIPTIQAAEHFSLRIQDRQTNALQGERLAASLEYLGLVEREVIILSEIRAGNIPNYLRVLVPVQVTENIDGQNYDLTLFVMPDYLSLGSDEDHFLIPMTPMLAQRIADEVGGILPTPRMVDLIWEAAPLKLAPQPIPPSPDMVTVGVFRDHNIKVSISRKAELEAHPLGTLVSGHKKDIVLSNRIASSPDKVMIYGWHYPTGKPIQPLYGGHVNWYADYSHGIRIVLDKCVLNGETSSVSQILTDPVLYQLLSDEEGPMKQTRYDTSWSNYP